MGRRFRGAGAGDAGVAGGGSQRPDWLPVWVLLPTDFEITFAFQDEGTGEAAVTGWIGDGDLQTLCDEA
ncbi:MAG: hypothetical protein QNL12_14935 [Acidimicrobiia bacterium]|nr:hypothetical protein [Acidimicrobiia bacterium]MDX2468609.1 hypothetical protein [Acidimicrobiia bacterium]